MPLRDRLLQSAAAARVLGHAARSTSRSNSAPAVAASSSRSAVAGRRRASRRADDLAHALRRRELVELTAEPDGAAGDLHRAAVDEAAPQLADQERVARRHVGDRARELGQALLAARRAAHELGHLVAGQAARGAAGRRPRSGAGRRASPTARRACPPRCRGRSRAAAAARGRPPRARWRSRPSVGASAQWASSSTSSTGRLPADAAPAGRRPPCAGGGARCPGRRPTGAAGAPVRAAWSGSRRASSPPVVPSAALSSPGR